MEHGKSSTTFVGGKLSEGRLKSTVLNRRGSAQVWEGKGEIPLHDPIIANGRTITTNKFIETHCEEINHTYFLQYFM